jgi:phospholipase C
VAGPVILKPGSRPYPRLPVGVDTLPQIDHIVVLMMENHTYDNYLGMLDRGDGLPRDRSGRPRTYNLNQAGQRIYSYHLTSPCQPESTPTQTWNASHIAFDHGRNDGFVRSGSGRVAMGYWTGEDLPFYYGLARTFPLLDRYFSSCLAQTYPNRRFLMAGTAYGSVSTTLPPLPGEAPPNGTIFDRLDRYGISWKNYFAELPSTFILPSIALGNLGHLAGIAQFEQDAAAGSLPGFSLVDPNFRTSSEENPQDIQVGEAFAARIVNAAMQGPAWLSTLLIWTYDEGGGYYDHVPPPRALRPDNKPPDIAPTDYQAGYDRYGFRVPTVVVSARAKRNYISPVVHDHTSILKLIETKWNLPAMTFRDANASNLLDSLDLTGRPPFADPPVLPAPKAPLPGRCST